MAELSLSTREIAALAQYFQSISAAGSFPPGSDSYSGNIPDLIAVVSRLDKDFVDSLGLPGQAGAAGLQFETVAPLSGLESSSPIIDLDASNIMEGDLGEEGDSSLVGESSEDMVLFSAGGRKRQRSAEDEEYGRHRTPTRNGSPSPRNVPVDQGENVERVRRRSKRHKGSDSGKRGNSTQWMSTNTISNTHGVPSQVGEAISMIFASAEISMASQSVVNTLRSLLSGGLWLEEMNAFRVDSLDAIVARCLRTEEMELGINFISMVNMIQFVAKIESIRVGSKLSSVQEVFRRELSTGSLKAYTLSKLQKWSTAGTKFISLAGAGSIYLLMLVASCDMRKMIVGLPSNLVSHLSSLIRFPSHDPFGKQVRTSIIPAISKLRSVLPPITFSTMFSSRLLSDHGLPLHIKCCDLMASDRFFDSIKTNTVVLARCKTAWACCLTPLSGDHDIDYAKNRLQAYPLSLMNQLLLEPPSTMHSNVPSSSRSAVRYSPTPHSPLTDIEDEDSFSEDISPTHLPFNLGEENIIIIDMLFDPEDPMNKKPPFHDHNPVFILEWTRKERKKAEKALVIENVDDLKYRLCDMLKSGRRHPDVFIKIKAKNFPNKIILVKDKYGGLLLLICSTMSLELRNTLVSKFTNVYPGRLMHTDSSLETATEGNGQFLHLDIYNRYNISGEGAPFDANPATIFRKGKKQPYFSQFIPRSSKELQENLSDYQRFIAVFEEVFTWQRSLVQKVLPDNFKNLGVLVETLPLNEWTPAYPFSGIVVNVNIATRAHRDKADEQVCMVLTISQCEGGALVLHESGIVVESSNGDCVGFPSVTQTHYNLDFIGLRASLVFHTDKDLQCWFKNMNGWIDNIYFSGR